MAIFKDKIRMNDEVESGLIGYSSFVDFARIIIDVVLSIWGFVVSIKATDEVYRSEKFMTFMSTYIPYILIGCAVLVCGKCISLLLKSVADIHYYERTRLENSLNVATSSKVDA